MTRVVAEIFAEPSHGDFRGDPMLWQYLKDYFAGVVLPYPVSNFQEDVFRIFQQFTGETPEAGGHYFVEAFPKDKSGVLSADFWLDEAIPNLSYRLEELNTALA